MRDRWPIEERRNKKEENNMQKEEGKYSDEAEREKATR
jgi:hypothetical protein